MHLSGTTTPFTPGMTVGSETIVRTFQPSCVTTKTGRLLVFCQGRLAEGADNQPKVIMINSSRDYGETWEGARIISGSMNHFALSAWSTPTDEGEGVSILVCVGLKVTTEVYEGDRERMRVETGIDIDEVGTDTASVLMRFDSHDDGETWTPTCLTGDDTPLYHRVDGYTPVFLNAIGQVHRIESGPYRGRLIIAGPIYGVPDSEALTSNFRNHPCSGSGVIWSDDDGNSWHLSGMVSDYQANEATAVSIREGRELLMIRRYNASQQFAKRTPKVDLAPGLYQRIAHTSTDCGATWSEPFLLPVSDVMCHGTLARSGGRIYFSIPYGRSDRGVSTVWDADRVRGAIYFSDDDGATWKHKLITDEPYSYSTVGDLGNGTRIALYARGGLGDEGIGCRTFDDEWLE